MGRGKLPMQLISNEKSRRKHLEKRKKSLEKAAKDLSTLCGVDIGMIIYASAHSDQPIATWPPGNEQVLAGLIDSYKATSCNKTYNLTDFLKDKTEKIEEKIKKLQSDGGLMAKIDAVRRRINLMKGSESLFTESSDRVLEDFYCNYSVDQESGVMWKYDELPPNFVYNCSGSGQANNNEYHADNHQLMMMNYGGGVCNGMYGFDENILPSYDYDQPLMSYDNGDVQNIETWPGSYDIVPMPTIDEQMPLDVECFLSDINTGGSGDEILSAKEWFLNEENILGT